MKASLFSPILVLLIITLFAKASMLFGRIQEQTTYSTDTSTSSVLLDTAYASTESHSNSPAPENENSQDAKLSSTRPDQTPAKNSIINNMTRSEMELLKELAKRREKLEKDKKDLSVREQVLKATENKTS